MAPISPAMPVLAWVLTFRQEGREGHILGLGKAGGGNRVAEILGRVGPG